MDKENNLKKEETLKTVKTLLIFTFIGSTLSGFTAAILGDFFPELEILHRLFCIKASVGTIASFGLLIHYLEKQSDLTKYS